MKKYLLPALAAALLAACGGGGGGGNNANDAPPVAIAVDTFIKQINDLVMTVPENGDLVAAESVTATAPENTEPVPI